jgi:hypothetical protein
MRMNLAYIDKRVLNNNPQSLAGGTSATSNVDFSPKLGAHKKEWIHVGLEAVRDAYLRNEEPPYYILAYNIISFCAAQVTVSSLGIGIFFAHPINLAQQTFRPYRTG